MKEKAKMKPALYRVLSPSPDGYYTAYIGRSNGDITRRLRSHFVTHHKFQKQLPLHIETKVEYAEFDTVADMYVAEIVYINLEKPPFNVDDKAPDKLTLNVDLSGIEWKPWEKTHLLDKWRNTV